jgi:RNA polymerase sigma-70 factor (ECF subfamily)
MDPRNDGTDLEDRQLVSGFLRRREEKAFRALYRRHAPALHRIALRLVRGRREDAEEILQNTWIRAVERLSGFRWESSLRSWLVGIAINCSRELNRRTGRIEELPEPVRVQDVDELPRLNGTVGRIDLERAIATLPDGYREVLVLHDIEGYTHSEIGSILGIEAGTSKSQLSHARRAVRARLAGLREPAR